MFMRATDNIESLLCQEQTLATTKAYEVPHSIPFMYLLQAMSVPTEVDAWKPAATAGWLLSAAKDRGPQR